MNDNKISGELTCRDIANKYRRKRKTIFERLQERLKKDLEIEATEFKRTYAGNWMKTDGAFVWMAKEKDGRTIGSTYPATEILKGDVLEIYSDGEIIPYTFEEASKWQIQQ